MIKSLGPNQKTKQFKMTIRNSTKKSDYNIQTMQEEFWQKPADSYKKLCGPGTSGYKWLI